MEPGPEDVGYNGKCNAKLREPRPDGRTRCGNPAGKGTNHKGIGACETHAGSTPTHVKSAQRKLAEREAAKSLAEMGVREITNPVEELVRLVEEIVAGKDYFAAKVAELGEQLTVIERVGDGAALVERINVLVSAYERALDRAERALVNLNRLGIEDRLARVQEQQVLALATVAAAVITGVLDELGVTDPRVPEIVRGRLELEAGRVAR